MEKEECFYHNEYLSIYALCHTLNTYQHMIEINDSLHKEGLNPENFSKLRHLESMLININDAVNAYDKETFYKPETARMINTAVRNVRCLDGIFESFLIGLYDYNRFQRRFNTHIKEAINELSVYFVKREG